MPQRDMNASNPPRNWFERGGDAYARFRPQYPPALASDLAALAPARGLAVDVGCGTGQLTTLLADHFDRVVGLDPSEDQIASATAHARVSYASASATTLPLADRSVDLVTAAQAAHWFDLRAFYAEVRRVSTPGGVIALVTYGVPRLPEDLDARFQRFYAEEIGPYWPPERRLVDRGYVDLPFPFAALAVTPRTIRVDWDLPAFLAYLGTWSAARRAREAGREDLLHAFAAEIGQGWGEPETRRAVVWPVHVRAGLVDGERAPRA